MKKLLLFASLLCLIQVKAQTLQWLHSFGNTGTEIGRSVTTDASGNVYSTGGFSGVIDFDPGPGTFTMNGTGSMLYISKLDAAGNFVWAKSLGGGTNIYAQSIAVDATGNVYTAGGFDGSADFDPGTPNVIVTSSGNTDAFVSKLDASGNYVWAKPFGGVSSFEYAYSLALDAVGDIYVTGSFNGTNTDFDPALTTYTLGTNGSYDAFVSKLTSAGNFVWAKKLGGGIADYGRCIKVDASNNVYTTGYYQNTADFDPNAGSYTLTSAGMNDIYVSKLDGSGNFIWAKSMGSASNDWGYGLDIDASGNV
ncbi:MAG: SBBP repeat-containing protein [Sphingobacteriaceae bacterium]|nr:SBBP repeat-containing protein [Sphingobacteriaceae bacterium]